MQDPVANKSDGRPPIPPVQPDSGLRLDGWKEISAHLRCDVRTCMRWEDEQGLPIHRINQEAKKSKVFAFTAELDAWLRRGRRANGAPHEEKPRSWFAKSWKIVAAAVGVVAAGLVAVLALAPDPLSGPADFHIQGQTILIVDGRDRILWPIEIPTTADLRPLYLSQDLVDDSGKSVLRMARPKVQFINVDRDRKKEVALFIHHDIPEKRGVALYDHNGVLLWQEDIRYDVEYALTRWGNDFLPVQLGAEDINGDGRPEILALWNHVKQCPSMLQVFSIEGEEIGHYDHTGTFQLFALRHRDDGSVDILLGGTNNLLDGDGVLVGLDGRNLPDGLGPPYDIPADLKDRAASLASFVPVATKRARQEFYIRFRHNEISRGTETFWIWAVGIIATSKQIGATLQMANNAFLYYHFSPDLILEDIQPGAEFRHDFPDWQARGIVKGSLESFLERCRRDVLYLDGESWSNRPPGTGLSGDRTP